MLIVTGGQTGADLAGWRAARSCGLDVSGWMPLGFLTEDGPRPFYADLYNAREMPTDSYEARTRANVNEADVVIWYGHVFTTGAKATFEAAIVAGKPVVVVRRLTDNPPATVAARISDLAPSVLMVAGNRASKATIPDEEIERHLVAVFALLGYPPDDR